MSTSTFRALISEKLALLGEDLANACENLARDREAELRDRNKQLLAENADLRYQLGLHMEGVIVELDESNTCQDTIMDIDNTRGTEILETTNSPVLLKNAGETPLHTLTTEQMLLPVARGSARKTFELLPELNKASFPHEDVFLGDIGDESTARDSGFANMLHHMETQMGMLKTVISTAGECPVIDPGSALRLSWDLLGIPILSWDLITIPLEVFDPPLPDFADYVTLIYWTLDIPFTFTTGIYDEEGKEVVNHKVIAMHYLRGFFFLDFGMIAADWTYMLIGLLTDGDGPSFLRNVALLRILRISRFSRLLRLKKLKEKVQALEDCLRSEFYLNIMDLITKMLSIVAINHYICCVWYAIGDMSSIAEPEHRWLTTYHAADGVLKDASFWYRYTTCLHWAITLMTPGGANIQPQNAYERVYCISALLFGLVVFSSFIASVTQARLSMVKMMGRFERQHWLLREYSRQNNVSTKLQAEMKRYIDVVVAPHARRLQLFEIDLVERLTPNLKQRLYREIFSKQITMHPFFAHVDQNYRSLMNSICATVIENMPLAKKDVAFSGGHQAQFMLIIEDGCCDYILVKQPVPHSPVTNGHWISEAAFWTEWIHQGQLQAIQDTRSMCIDGARFRSAVLRSAVCMRLVRNYGSAFCQNLNDVVRRRETLSDLHEFAEAYFAQDDILKDQPKERFEHST